MLLLMGWCPIVLFLFYLPIQVQECPSLSCFAVCVCVCLCGGCEVDVFLNVYNNYTQAPTVYL